MRRLLQLDLHCVVSYAYNAVEDVAANKPPRRGGVHRRKEQRDVVHHEIERVSRKLCYRVYMFTGIDQQTVLFPVSAQFTSRYIQPVVLAVDCKVPPLCHCPARAHQLCTAAMSLQTPPHGPVIAVSHDSAVYAEAEKRGLRFGRSKFLALATELAHDPHLRAAIAGYPAPPADAAEAAWQRLAVAAFEYERRDGTSGGKRMFYVGTPAQIADLIIDSAPAERRFFNVISGPVYAIHLDVDHKYESSDGAGTDTATARGVALCHQMVARIRECLGELLHTVCDAATTPCMILTACTPTKFSMHVHVCLPPGIAFPDLMSTGIFVCKYIRPHFQDIDPAPYDNNRNWRLQKNRKAGKLNTLELAHRDDAIPSDLRSQLIVEMSNFDPCRQLKRPLIPAEIAAVPFGSDLLTAARSKRVAKHGQREGARENKRQRTQLVASALQPIQHTEPSWDRSETVVLQVLPPLPVASVSVSGVRIAWPDPGA